MLLMSLLSALNLIPTITNGAEDFTHLHQYLFILDTCLFGYLTYRVVFFLKNNSCFRFIFVVGVIYAAICIAAAFMNIDHPTLEYRTNLMVAHEGQELYGIVDTSFSGSWDGLDITVALHGALRKTKELIKGHPKGGTLLKAAVDMYVKDASDHEHHTTRSSMEALALNLKLQESNEGSTQAPPRFAFGYAVQVPVSNPIMLTVPVCKG